MVAASVLMPVYDEDPARLETAVASVLRQTFRDFEVVVIDDGSTESSTRSFLDALPQRDGRISVLREPHRGITATLNRGLQSCRGAFIFRHDSDDWSEPSRFEEQIGYLRANPDVVIVGSNITLHQEAGSPLWNAVLPANVDEATFEMMNPFCHGAVCFRADAACDAGGYREQLPCTQDYDFFWRLIERGRGANLQRPLYHLRQTAASISARRGADQARVTVVTRELARMRRSGEQEDFAAATAVAERMLSRRATAVGHERQADRLLLAGRYSSALGENARLIVSAPFAPRSWMKLLRSFCFIVAPPVRRWLFQR